jgi:hypothetical protein
VIDLRQGAVRFRFAGGAEVIVEGPARFKAMDAHSLFLWSSRAVARVTGPTPGFVIDTPRARLTDVGTEFGVGVDFSGATEIQVFEGAVLADFRHPENAQGKQQRIDAGQAWQVHADPQTQPEPAHFIPTRFTRTLPARRAADPPPGPLYNQPDFDTIHVVPAPAGLRIDGDLGDWDRTAAFRSACREPYGQHYYVEGMMMYDARQFYIGAHVGDPAPLCNAIEAEEDPQNSWRGGSVVVRLAASANLGWPIQGRSPGLRKAAEGSHPQDRSEQLAHLTLFYHRPTQRARLDIAYGMDFHGRRLDPPGWQGAFRADADGHGYTLEYAIPWNLLHAERHVPVPGDVLAATCSVHWSDQEGRLCFGHLTDIVSAAYRPYLFHQYRDGASWGRAVFHAKGDVPVGDVLGSRDRHK